MSTYDVDAPEYSGTTTDDWEAPRQEDFDTDDLDEIADHFVRSESGSP